MRGALGLAWAACAFVALASVASLVIAQKAPADVATGTIVGVVLGIDGRPAPDVTVTAQPDSVKMRLSPQALTDDLGEFEIADIAEGDYNLKFTTADAKYVAGKSVSVFPDKTTNAGTVRLKKR